MAETTFNVKIQGLTKLQNAFASAPDIVGPILKQAIARTPDILAGHTDSQNGGGTTPYRTGQLIHSFRRHVDGLKARWFPTVYYAPFVEFGHKQEVGRFVPTIKKRLVNPTVKANPFMERIRSRSREEINATFREAGRVIAQAIATQP